MRACYACLLSFFNQRHHDLFDRMLVLPWLQALGDLDVTPIVSEDRFAALSARCESQLERQVLAAIRGRSLPLPTAAQQTILDGDAPLVIADFNTGLRGWFAAPPRLRADGRCAQAAAAQGAGLPCGGHHGRVAGCRS